MNCILLRKALTHFAIEFVQFDHPPWKHKNAAIWNNAVQRSLYILPLQWERMQINCSSLQLSAAKGEQARFPAKLLLLDGHGWNTNFLPLESTDCYAGLLPDSSAVRTMEGFGLWPRNYLPFGQVRSLFFWIFCRSWAIFVFLSNPGNLIKRYIYIYSWGQLSDNRSLKSETSLLLKKPLTPWNIPETPPKTSTETSPWNTSKEPL